VAQSTNNNYGVAGIAYEATLMPLKVLSGGGGGTVADIAESIRFAADNGADVINMSLGGGGESQLMKEAIDYAHQKGVVIIAAAGNSNDNSASYPARYPHVIGVSALDSAGTKAPTPTLAQVWISQHLVAVKSVRFYKRPSTHKPVNPFSLASKEPVWPLPTLPGWQP
jgi:subtilisin family serine protease